VIPSCTPPSGTHRPRPSRPNDTSGRARGSRTAGVGGHREAIDALSIAAAEVNAVPDPWQPVSEPVPVRVHDFIDQDLGKVIPYGVYDLARYEGWVNVGIDHYTPEFAVASIARWWSQMGRTASR
jgi:hypothetical protein